MMEPNGLTSTAFDILPCTGSEPRRNLGGFAQQTSVRGCLISGWLKFLVSKFSGTRTSEAFSIFKSTQTSHSSNCHLLAPPLH